MQQVQYIVSNRSGFTDQKSRPGAPRRRIRRPRKTGNQLLDNALHGGFFSGNALAGDPPLKQVSTRTVEAGLRGGPESPVNWTLGWFWSENHDDILFVSSFYHGPLAMKLVSAGVRLALAAWTVTLPTRHR